ncbi:hypothetical protein L596_021541 [Steinernema carpocapsae]|uniref:Uncharacterized protein n=1 Tax=Steinernema carpocapsae TaxID=34508 RepID=A0A4U5MJ21_STECR|nr:hypothetical protein L596_021541 [Steinernema carpocapsae]
MNVAKAAKPSRMVPFRFLTDVFCTAELRNGNGEINRSRAEPAGSRAGSPSITDVNDNYPFFLLVPLLATAFIRHVKLRIVGILMAYCELREKVPKNCIWKDKTECYVKWW